MDNNQNQQLGQSPVPEAPIPPKQPIPKPKPKWLVPVIVIVGIIVIGLIVWGAYELFKPTPPEDEFKDWETYRNEEYGFELKYPGNWKFEELSIKRTTDLVAKINFIDSRFEFQTPLAEPIDFPGGLTVEIYDGIKEDRYPQGTEFLSGCRIKNNLQYCMFASLTLTTVPEEQRTIFNQILSTFKFIEPSENANILNVQGIKMTIPDKWSIDRKIENVENITGYTRVYIKTDYQPYNVFLVLDIPPKNSSHDIETFKEKRGGGDYTKIKDGEIFKSVCGGALACNGAIVNDNVYTFSWDIEGDQPVPKDLNGVWMPDHDVTQEDIWNILLSIEVE